MQDSEAHSCNRELKQLVVEASQALARLDAARLEELALSCQALTGMLNTKESQAFKPIAQQAREARSDMAVFARVLDATRANLNVMNRLRELHAGRVEYTEGQVHGGRRRMIPSKSDSENLIRSAEGVEAQHGND